MSTKQPTLPPPFPRDYYDHNRPVSPPPPKVKYVRNSTDDLISRIKTLEEQVCSLESQIEWLKEQFRNKD